MKNTSSYVSVRIAGSCLTLEVISGPSRGIRCSVQSINTSKLPLTLGRVSPSDLLLKDSEVSGKHAMINWNLNVNLHNNYIPLWDPSCFCAVYMVLIILYMHYCCQKMKWELVDMGSLNGTLLNSRSINHPDSGSRNWGDPIELASGDVITLGTTSQLYVS